MRRKRIQPDPQEIGRRQKPTRIRNRVTQHGDLPQNAHPPRVEGSSWSQISRHPVIYTFLKPSSRLLITKGNPQRNSKLGGYCRPGKDFSGKLFNSNGNFTTSQLPGTMESAEQEMGQGTFLKPLPSWDNMSPAMVLLLLGGMTQPTPPRPEDSTFCPQREGVHRLFSL